MGRWTIRHWMTAAGVTAIAAVAIGVPTGVVATPLYTRMTPVLWWNYPVWTVSSLLTGLLVATYVGQPATCSRSGPRSGRAVVGGLLSAFAVGCPVCNKLVVLALGTSGAMSYWAPAQPLLAVASLALLAHALRRRLRTADACPASVRGSQDAAEPPDTRLYDGASQTSGASRSGGGGSRRASAG